MFTSFLNVSFSDENKVEFRFKILGTHLPRTVVLGTILFWKLFDISKIISLHFTMMDRVFYLSVVAEIVPRGHHHSHQLCRKVSEILLSDHWRQHLTWLQQEETRLYQDIAEHKSEDAFIMKCTDTRSYFYLNWITSSEHETLLNTSVQI